MYKKFLLLLFCFFVPVMVAHAAVIEVLDLGNGFFRILSDGQPYGGAVENQLSKSAVDKVLKALDNGKNIIKRTPIPNTNLGGGAGSGGMGGVGGGSASAKTGTSLVQKANNTTTSVVKYDPAVANSGGSAAGATTSKSLVPANNAGGAAAPKALGPGTTGAAGGAGGGGAGGSNAVNAATNATKTGGVTAGSAIMSGLAIVGGVAGGIDFYNNAQAKDRKTTWGDVGRSAVDGAAVTAGGAAIINLIPGLGQIGYGAAIAVGAVAGAIHTGRKMFSETDCEYDPIIGVYSCCHTSKAMSNIQARNVDIGGEMFCDAFPYVTKCVQGRKEYETDQGFRGLFLNDHWSKTCSIKYCAGYSEPNDPEGTYTVRFAGKYTDDGGACWFWECPEGMEREGSKCVSSAETVVQETSEDTKPGGTKYNYKPCSSDSDCTGIDNTKRPYLHSTAWHCAWQSAGVRVCTATACDDGWTPKNGYCQENKSGTALTTTTDDDDDDGTTTDNSSTPPANNNGGNAVPAQPVQKTCPDSNMDSNCNCTKVPETTKRNNKCECIDSNKVIKNGKCEYSAAYLAQLESEINTHYDSLHAIMSGLKVNVWRDSEGNFNTARLASDSIAGVVLGTVGGIVTANLVKKSQVKQGFEDMKCSIGGQSVAGFGDEFTVGR